MSGVQTRKDLDKREREVFIMRRDGYTFQEITDLLTERAEKVFEESGKRVTYYSSVAGVKQAYDRYIMRCPERFDLAERKEQLELAIRRAEANYRHASALSRDAIIEESDRIRWSDQTGKWFDRLSKLRALTEDSTIINNFTQNNLIVSDSELLAKLTAAIESSTFLIPDLDAHKSAGTVPPAIGTPAYEFEYSEIITNDGEFDEPESETEIEVFQPTGEVRHEAIKLATRLSNIDFAL